VTLVRGISDDIRERSVLELGPGINFGSSLVLACHGARVLVADRFLAPWQDPYHPSFYRALNAWLADNRLSLDRTPLTRIISTNAYPRHLPIQVHAPAERLAGLADCTVDIVLSNAVLEHVINLAAVAAELYRVTKPGGLGIHQVDFRDHRDFAHPLEYLLLGDAEFGAMFRRSHGECGSQIRHEDLTEQFRCAGFEILHFDANMFAEDRYLDDFLPRLRGTASRYREVPRETLAIISGRLFLRKPKRATALDSSQHSN